MINDGPHANSPSQNSTIKRQKTDIINLVKKELKTDFKNDTVTFKYIDYDESNLFKVSKDIEEQIKNLKPDIIFGPFLHKTVSFIRETIEKSPIPFVSFAHYSSLRPLNNYFTPYEWHDVKIKLAIELAKRILNKDSLKIGVFVQVTDDYSSDSYEHLKKFLEAELYTVKLVHSKLNQYWNYKYKLDEGIQEMIKFSPDVILNANSRDLAEITDTINLKMTDKGFKGLFIDTGSWGCSESSISRNINVFKDTKGASTGIIIYQKKCFISYDKDEKKIQK
jgi:hypothetical protein